MMAKVIKIWSGSLPCVGNAFTGIPCLQLFPITSVSVHDANM